MNKCPSIAASFSIAAIVLFFTSPALPENGQRVDRDVGQLMNTLLTGTPKEAEAARLRIVALGRPAVPALVAALGEVRYYGPERKRLVAVLASIGSHAVPGLVVAMRGGDRELRRACSMALRDMGYEAHSATPALFETLLDMKTGRVPRDTDTVIIIREALRKLGRKAVPHLVAYKQSDDPEARKLASKVFSYLDIDSGSSDEELIRDLRDENGHLRVLAAEALSERGDEYIPYLLDWMDDPTMHDHISRIISRRTARVGVALPALERCVMAKSFESAKRCLIVIERIQGSEVLDVLERCAENASSRIQETCKEALTLRRKHPERSSD